MNIKIHGAGYNAEPLVNLHTISKPGIGLYVCGLKKSKEYYPDGKVRTFDVSSRTPSLRLYFPGGVSEYEYSNVRENWWVTFDEPSPIRYDFALQQPFYCDGENEFPILPEIPLDPTEICSVRMIFSEIRDCWLAKSKLGMATAELLVSWLLARFLRTEFKINLPSVAERYKRLIDADVRWTMSLEELGKKLALRRDDVRKCFIEKYGITPQQYRINMRLAQITNLITSSDLSVKEIAWHCGLKNVTYLNALTSKYFDATPLELIKKFRRVNK